MRAKIEQLWVFCRLKYGVRPIRKVKYYLYYFIFFVFLFWNSSCGTKKGSEQGILSQSEMVHSLMNIYITEQKVSALGLPRDTAVIIFKKLNARMLDSLQVQDSVIQKSYNYYLERPRELEEIYTALVDSLNLREQKAVSASGPLWFTQMCLRRSWALIRSGRN